MDRRLLVNHVVAVAKTGVGFRLPIVHSTVNVKTGLNKPPIPPLRKVVEEYPTYDRISMNACARGARNGTAAIQWTLGRLAFGPPMS